MQFWSVTVVSELCNCSSSEKKVYSACVTDTLILEEEKKTNKKQQLDVCYQLLSQHVLGIIMPIFRRTKTVLLHMVYCSGSAGCGW